MEFVEEVTVKRQTAVDAKRTGEADVMFPDELLTAIQIHFNQKIPIDFIRDSLRKNKNDLFKTLSDLNSSQCRHSASLLEE